MFVRTTFIGCGQSESETSDKYEGTDRPDYLLFTHQIRLFSYQKAQLHLRLTLNSLNATDENR